MSEPYVNPENKPFVGRHTWEPTQVPAGNATVYGYTSQFINPGKFRNDIPTGAVDNNGDVLPNSNSYTVGIETTGSILNGEKNSPFLSSFRSISRPTLNLKTNSSGDFQLKATDKGLGYKIKINSPTRISAIKLVYSLSYDSSAKDAKSAINHFERSTDGNYPFIKISVLANSSENWTEYPEDKSELMTTYDNKTGKTTVRTAIIKFGSTNVASSYPFLQYINISNRYSIESLNLILYKVMIFDAAAVNLSPDQLPCKLLQYAYNMNFKYLPTKSEGIVFPGAFSATEPNFFVKLFSPDDLSGTVGFAHSINLRFMIFSLPTYLSPFSTVGGLQGVMFDMAYPMYMTTFIGPTTSTRSAKFNFSSIVAQPANSRAVRLDKFEINNLTRTILLKKAKNYTGDTAPSSAEWESLVSYSIKPVPSPEAPFAREFLYIDSGAVEKEWYQITQSNRSNINEIFDQVSESFSSEIYSEHTLLGMSPNVSQADSTITRRIFLDVDPLEVEPVLTFIQNDEAYFSSGAITFRKGAWTLRLNASTNDADNLVSTYLFARYWFQPVDEVLNFDDINKWRKQTEIYFKFNTETNQCEMVKGTPTSTADLMVSSTLSTNLREIEMRKYMDVAQSVTMFSDVKARLVVGIYSISYRNGGVTSDTLNNKSINLPTFSITTGGQLKTTILQATTSRLLPQKLTRYNKSYYQDYIKLYLTAHRVSLSDIVAEQGDYAKYTEHYNVASTTKAFDNLLILQEYADDSEIKTTKIYLPYSSIPVEKSTSTFVYQDFVTFSIPFVDAQVFSGTWKIDIDIDVNTIQDEQIKEEYRLQIFFATVDGIVVSRVIDTGYISRTDTTISFETAIDISFLCGQGNNIQLVFRLMVYPYSAKNQIVDIDTLTTTMSGVPVGLRINKLNISETSVGRLIVEQTDSFVGSPAYYENLPITPSRTISGDEFLFIANSDLVGKTLLTFPDIETDIQGVLYSPIWYTQLPDSIEVKLGASYFESDMLWFRTVPYSADVKEIPSIAATEDRALGMVALVNDDVPPVSLVTDYEKVVRKRILPHPSLPAVSNDIVKDTNGNIFPGYNSHVSYVNTTYGQSSGKSSVLGIVAERTGTQYNITSSILDFTTGVNTNSLDIVNTAMVNDGKQLKNVANNISFPILVQPKYSSGLFVTGWRDNLLLGKYLNIWNSSLNEVDSTGIYYLIDGPKDTVAGDYIFPSNLPLNGAILEGHHGAAYIGAGKILTAYLVEGMDGIILGRIFSNDGGTGNTMTLISIPAMLGRSSDFSLVVSAPVLVYNDMLDITYISFYCGGKIFMTYLSGVSSGHVGLNPLRLIAGSSNLDNSDNVYNSMFKELHDNGNLVLLQSGEVENDVPEQRAGFVTATRDAGNLYIYYKNSSDVLKARRIYGMGLVGEAIDV